MPGMDWIGLPHRLVPIAIRLTNTSMGCVAGKSSQRYNRERRRRKIVLLLAAVGELMRPLEAPLSQAQGTGRPRLARGRLLSGGPDAVDRRHYCRLSGSFTFE